MAYRIERTGAGVAVYAEEEGTDLSLSPLPGVECLTPDQPVGRRTYRKRFFRKKIYLPDERPVAVNAHLARTPSTFVLGMNGYSRLTPEQCRAWGVQPRAYEILCQEILVQAVRRLRRSFDGIEIVLVHGASDMGVDAAVMAAARETNCRQLGFNCLPYLFYVADDEQPVYVAETAAAYSDAFVASLDVLIAANGRLQAYETDISAVFKHRKRLIPVNVLRLISSSGGPPAEDGSGKIEDAVAFFEQRVWTVGQRTASLLPRDQVPVVVTETGSVLEAMARYVLPPECGLRLARA